MSDDTTMQEPQTDTADTSTAEADRAQPEVGQTTNPDTPDLAGEVAKWKAMSRKHEAEADRLRKQQMSDGEKAVAEAEQRGRESALAEASKAVAKAEVKAALTGLVESPQPFVDLLDLSSFVGESGVVDQDAIENLRGLVETIKPTTQSPPDLGQGVGFNGGPKQLDRASLSGMTPEQIVEAKQAGQLNELLGIN